MIISLTNDYDTSKKVARTKLLKELNGLLTHAPTLAAVRMQIEHATYISATELDIYNLCGDKPAIQRFKSTYIDQTNEDLTNKAYTFLNDAFYVLPDSDNSDSLVYALIDKLVYEAMRHDFNKEPCKSLRAAISKFMPESKKYTLTKFSSLLAQHETSSATYYGECLSDDSDSDEEEQYNITSQEKKNAKQIKAKTYRVAAHSNKFFQAFKNQSVVDDEHVCERPHIAHLEGFDRRQAVQDLKQINERIEQGIAIDTGFLETLTTQFLVAQYRGIHYITSSWDAAARREHRALDEVGKPQYSSAVFNLEGVTGYRDMLNKMRDNPNFKNKLTQTAEAVEDLLLQMQQSGPCTFKGYAYNNLFLLLQKQYSADYDGFSDWVDGELERENSVLAQFIKTSQRPLFSTSDVPNHALKYAYGIKLYKGHQHERLLPRWRSDLLAERPYSGKVYLSLHPLTDYEQHKPSHLTSLFKTGQVNLSNVIVAERETSFLGYMPAERVAYHFKAKYPSFAGSYKNIMFYKYGINEPMYAALKKAFEDWAPHTNERKNVIKSLGDYLAAYNEVRLVAKAEKLARKQNKILIYRDEDGLYSLYLPETPTTANKRLRALINKQRDVYKAIAEGKKTGLEMIAREQFDNDVEVLQFIQSHCALLLKNGYTLSYLKTIEFKKLKLINKPLQKLIVEDRNNLTLLLDFSLSQLELCSDDQLLELLDDEYISLEELDTWDTQDLSNLLAFDNLVRALDEGYSLEDLSELLSEDEWHIHCLTADSIEDLILEQYHDVPDLVLEYAEHQGADFEFIMDTLSSSKRKVFRLRLEEYRAESSESDAEGYEADTSEYYVRTR